MAKYTDAIRDAIIAAFNAGDQPTEAQFTNWITRVQEGIEEHEHDGTGDGDGVNLDRIAFYLASALPYNSKGNHFNTVQAAIDDLAGDGWVFVPDGVWVENLTIPDDYVTLYGSGWSSVINGGTGAGHAIDISGVYCVVRDLRAYTTADGGLNYPITVSAAGVSIETVFISSSDSIGITLAAGAPQASIRDCFIRQTVSSGIYVAAPEARIWGNKILDATTYGIQIIGTGDNAVITSNIIDTTGNDGILIDADAEYCIVIGNRIKDFTNEGIDDNSGTSIVEHNKITP